MRAIRCSMEGSMCATGRMFDTPAQEQSLWWFRNSALSPYIHKEYDTFSIYPQRHMVLFPCIHTEIWRFLSVPKKKSTISGTHLWIWLHGAKEKLHDYLCCKTPRVENQWPKEVEINGFADWSISSTSLGYVPSRRRRRCLILWIQSQKSIHSKHV